MLRSLTIRMRVIAVIAFLSLEVLLGAFLGIFSLSRANDAMESIYEDRLVPTGELDQVVRLIQENQLLISKAIDAINADTVSGESTVMDAQIKRMDDNRAKIDQHWNAYMQTSMDADERALSAQFDASHKKFQNEGMALAMAALKENSLSAIDILHGPVTQLSVPVQSSIDGLIKLQLKKAKTTFEASQSTYRLVRNAVFAAVAFGMLLTTLVGAWLVHAICHPLESAVQIAGNVASGDLRQDIKVDSDNETGRLMKALKEMNDSLVNIVGKVRIGTDSIATASAEIAAGNADLSLRAEQQASSLGETAASMEELTSTVKQSADNARLANQLAKSASEVATKGGAVVDKVVETMGSINASSMKIVDIISVIDGIAFQTNILALNAAVEAARAG